MGEVNCKRSRSQGRLFWRTAQYLLPITTHIVLILVYFYPLYANGAPGEQVFDEQVVLDFEVNQDTAGRTSFFDLFKHDYWGYRMDSIHSNGSYRPVIVMSIRYLNLHQKLSPFDDIFVHRMVSVLIHVTLAECVSLLGFKLFVNEHHSNKKKILLRTSMKLLFGLHPTHVEAVANVANRSHVATVLFSVLVCDDRTNIWITTAMWLIGMLSGETIVFQLPAVIITMIAIQYFEKSQNANVNSLTKLTNACKSVLPKIITVTLLTMAYLGVRFTTKLNTIGKPRVIEVDFFYLTGLSRIFSYAYVTVVHIGKALFIDPIGHSFEYGFSCLQPVYSLADPRQLIVILAFGGIIVWGIWSYRRGLNHVLYFLVAAGWGASMFPLMGFIVIGTFVADRMMVGITIVTSLFGGAICTNVITSKSFAKSAPRRVILYFALLSLIVSLIHGVIFRSRLWTDSWSLKFASWNACPLAVKVNYDISTYLYHPDKYQERLDADKARVMIERAIEIYPQFCLPYFQLTRLLGYDLNLSDDDAVLEFEQYLLKSIGCPEASEFAQPLLLTYQQRLYQHDPSEVTQSRIEELNRKQIEQIESIAAQYRKTAEAMGREVGKY